MNRFLTAILALALALPCRGAIEYAYDEADQQAVARFASGDTIRLDSPATNRLTNLTQQPITDYTFNRQLSGVPRSSKVTAVGYPGSIIWDTHDTTKNGGWYNSAIGGGPLYFKAVDTTRNKIIAATSDGRIFAGTVGASTITWVEILNYATYGGVFDDPDWAYDTDFLRVLYGIKVSGDVMTLYFGGPYAAQPNTPNDITDDPCKVYSGTWNGSAWGGWTGAMTSEYGSPAEPWAIDQKETSIVWGTYNSLDYSDHVAYYISSDNGLTWTTLFDIERETDNSEGFKVHCHGCFFGSSVDEVFAVHGDNAAPIRHFQKLAGVWTLVANRLRIYSERTTTIDGGISGVTLNVVDPVFHSLMYSGTYTQGIQVVIGTEEEERSVAGVTDNNTVTLDASVTKAAGEPVRFEIPEPVTTDRAGYANGKLYFARHGTNIPAGGNPSSLFYIDRSTWKITNTQMIPAYYGDTNGPYRNTTQGNLTGVFYIDGLLFACYPAFSTDWQRTGMGLYCSADGLRWTPVIHDVNDVLSDTIILRGVRGILPQSVTNTSGQRMIVGIAGRGLKAISTTLDGNHTDTNIVDTVGAIWDKVYIGCNITIAGVGTRQVTGYTDTTTVTVSSNYTAVGGTAITLSAQTQTEIGFAMPMPVARTLDGFLVQKGGANDIGNGVAAHDYLWSLEAGTETLPGNGWAASVYPMITPNAGLGIDNTVGSHGSKSMKIFCNGDAGTPSTYMCYGEVNGPSPPVKAPVSDEKITVLYWARQDGEQIQSVATQTYGGTYLYMPAASEAHHVGDNWQRIFTHYRWKANGLNTEWRIDTARWVANMLKTSSIFIDNFTLVHDQYRWYSHSLMPYWSGNASATRTWPDEWVNLAIPSSGTSYTLVMDWFPLEPAWHFFENLPIFTLRGASGAYLEVGWVDTTDGTYPARIYATDGSATKYSGSPIRFLHWDDIKIAVTVNAGVPTTMYLWDGAGGWQTVSLTSGGSLASLGKSESLELGTDNDHTASAGNHAAVGSGRFANVRLHSSELPESAAKATMMDVTSKMGSNQRRLGGGGGLYLNPN